MTIKHRASCQSRVFWCLSNLPNMAGMCGPNFRPVYCCCCEFWNPPTVAGIGQTAQMMQPVRFDVVATDILHITYYYYYITYNRLCAAHQLSTSVCPVKLSSFYRTPTKWTYIQKVTCVFQAVFWGTSYRPISMIFRHERPYATPSTIW